MERVNFEVCNKDFIKIMIFLIDRMIVTKRSSHIHIRDLQKVFFSLSNYYLFILEHLLNNQYHIGNVGSSG